MVKKRKFTLQAHFRHKSVHFDLRLQHPDYPTMFFGYTIFIDAGKLDDNNLSVTSVDLGKKILKEWKPYFKDWGDAKRMGVRKQMGSAVWLNIDGAIEKKLLKSSYTQVMLKVNTGYYKIMEDHYYSQKITFYDVKSHHGAPIILEDDTTWIFRYIPIKTTRNTPFNLLSWKLKSPKLSDSEFQFVKTLKGNKKVYETSAGELFGQYLIKTSDGWFTADRHPIYENSFTIVKNKYELTETKYLGEFNDTIYIFKSDKEDVYHAATK